MDCGSSCPKHLKDQAFSCPSFDRTLDAMVLPARKEDPVTQVRRLVLALKETTESEVAGAPFAFLSFLRPWIAGPYFIKVD